MLLTKLMVSLYLNSISAVCAFSAVNKGLAAVFPRRPAIDDIAQYMHRQDVQFLHQRGRIPRNDDGMIRQRNRLSPIPPKQGNRRR